MQDKTNLAVGALKAAKSQGLTYYDATQSLAKQGFSQQEIEQASYQFPYTDIETLKDTPNTSAAINQAIVHEEVLDNAKQELQKDLSFGFLGGRSIFGSYFGSKVITDYAAYKDLKEQGKIQGAKTVVGSRVFQRNRAIKYYGFLSLVPLVLFSPYFFFLLLQFPAIISTIFVHHDRESLGSLGMYIWSGVGYFAYFCITALLFLAKKETTITRGITIVMCMDLVLFVLFAILFKSLILLVLGVLTLMPSYWISKRVGILSQLD